MREGAVRRFRAVLAARGQSPRGIRAAMHPRWNASPTRPRCSACGFIHGLLGLVLLLSGVPLLPAAGQSITVVSWGGSYARAVNEGANIPFTDATGIRVSVEAYNGGLAQIRAQVDIGNIHWDVVDLEMADAVRGCDEGLLELIDIDDLPPGPDGTPAADDFAAESQTECGVGNLYWSTVYAYNDENFPGENPPQWPTSSTWRDSRGAAGCGGYRRRTWSSP